MSYLFVITSVHVVISLLAIVAGVFLAADLATGHLRSKWTGFFLLTTTLTSVTGFGFPVAHVTPAHVLGVISLAALGLAYQAYSRRHLAGHWRIGYVTSTLFSFYLNVFVLIVQSFAKIPSLKSLAPTQTEFPFVAVQLLAMAVFVSLGIASVARSRRMAAAA